MTSFEVRWRHSTEQEVPTVANTCIALQAFVRAGFGPGEGPYGRQIEKAIGFVLTQIEESDPNDLFITPYRDTQLQKKLGVVPTNLICVLLEVIRGFRRG